MSASELHTYYAARAPEYDRIYQKPERQADLRAIEHWLPAALAGREILEVACGTGYWTQFLAPAAKSILALDAAPETLRIARARVQSPQVRFVVGDAYRLPAGERSFDAAFAGFWFSHVPRSRVREFLLGLHAALAPGATVIFLDNRFVPGSSTPIAEHDAEGNAYQLRPLADGSTHRVLKNFPSEAELLAAIAELGDEARVHQWEYFWALEYTAGPAA